MMRLAILLVLCAVCLPVAFAGEKVNAARKHLVAGHYGAAIETARDLIKTEDPESVEGRRILGDALAATGKIEEALDHYKAIPPGTDGPRLDVEMAVSNLEEVYGERTTGLERARRVLSEYQVRRSRLSPPELLAAGDAARKLAPGDAALYSTALQLYEEAVEHAPEDPATHTAIADLLLDRYNNKEALEAYRAALKLDGDFVPALKGLAHSHYFDRSAGALKAVHRVLELRPTDVGALVLLARLKLELEQYSEVEEILNRALAVNPRSPGALTLAAALAFLRGDDQAFDMGTKRIRNAASGYMARFYETLAEVAAQNRYYDEASQFARRAVVLDSNAWHALALSGVNRLRLGEMEAGRQALEAAFRGDPYDARTRNALELLDRLEDYEQARSERFVLVAAPREARVLAPLLLPIAEQAYERFANRYGHSPPTPVRIELFRNHEDFSVRITGLVGVDLKGVSFGPVVALDFSSGGAAGAVNAGSVLWHEIAHTFHLGLTRSRVPRWFSEGLAVFEEHRARPGWGFDVSPGFLTAFLEGRLPAASELNQAFLRPSYPEQLVHAYYQASLVMHLIDRDHGFDAIAKMMEAYREGGSTAEILPHVLGQTPKEFDAAFEAYVRERFGEALKALSPVPDAHNAGTQQGRYPRLMREARLALASGDLDRAFDLLTEAQDLFPEHAGSEGTHSLLAALHVQRGEPGKAIAQLERSISIDANDLEAHQRLVDLYLQLGDGGGAARVLDQTLLIQPFDPDLYLRLAEIRESREEWEQAVKARTAIVALDPGDPAGAWYELARSRHRAGDGATAKRDVLSALEIAPLYQDALELLLALKESSNHFPAGGSPHSETAPPPEKSSRIKLSGERGKS